MKIATNIRFSCKKRNINKIEYSIVVMPEPANADSELNNDMKEVIIPPNNSGIKIVFN